MKTIRLLGLALTAIIISVNLSACGDDDSDSPETPVDPQAKHITRVVQEEDDGDKIEYIYNYDSQGRVIAMMEQETYKTRVSRSYLYTFTYNDNTITVNEEDKYIYTYSLLDGRITSLRSEYKYSTGTETRVTSYSYDAQGHLKSMNEDDENQTYTWSGGDLTEMDQTFQEHDGERHHWYKIDYNSDTAPTNYMHIGLYNGYEAALAMMGYFGKMPTHLTREITRHHADGDYYTTTFTYQIQEGRPIKIDFTHVNLRNNNPGTPDFGKITLEWN